MVVGRWGGWWWRASRARDPAAPPPRRPLLREAADLADGAVQVAIITAGDGPTPAEGDAVRVEGGGGV